MSKKLSRARSMQLIAMETDELNKLCESEEYKNADHEGKRLMSFRILDKYEALAK